MLAFNQPCKLHDAVVTYVALKTSAYCLLSNLLACRRGDETWGCALAAPHSTVFPLILPKSMPSECWISVTSWAKCNMEGNMGEQTDSTIAVTLGHTTKHTSFFLRTPTYAIPIAILYSPLLFFEMLNTLRYCGGREPHLWSAACRLPSLQWDILLLSCLSCRDEDRTRTNSQQVLEWWCICCCVWGCGLLWWWLSLFAQTASAEDASSFATSILCSLNLITCPQMTLLPFLSQLGDLMSGKLLQSSAKAVCFLYLGSFSCKDVCMYVCILHDTAASPFLPPTCQARQKPQNGRGRWIAGWLFSAKPLLKIPGKLISFPPCSAIVTSIFPKTACLLYLPAAKIVSTICF